MKQMEPGRRTQAQNPGAGKHQAGKLLAAAAVCLLMFSSISDTMAINTYVRDLKGMAVPVQSFQVEHPSIALTFDVGATPTDRVSDVLEQLHKAKIKGTFFLSGEWVTKNPRTAREIVRQGHEVGQTLYTYRKASEMTEEEIRLEIAEAKAAWRKAGLPDTRLFRVPYGESKGPITKVIRERGDRLIAWSINAAWETSSGKATRETIAGFEPSFKPGDIVRMRVDKEAALELPMLIKRAKEAGFGFLTISMFGKGGREG
jgi:peptidoglycan/xylan/chitin deacetylase (PgdA/CDA1 family)